MLKETDRTKNIDLYENIGGPYYKEKENGVLYDRVNDIANFAKLGDIIGKDVSGKERYLWDYVENGERPMHDLTRDIDMLRSAEVSGSDYVQDSDVPIIDSARLIPNNNKGANTREPSKVPGGWASSKFMAPGKELILMDKINRFYSLAMHKTEDTSLGNHSVINPLPQFTRYADIRVTTNPDAPTGHKGGTKYFATGLGMGRYYSEAIDDYQQHVYMQFGVPEFNSMIRFLTNAVSYEDAYIATHGRYPIEFGLAKLAVSVATGRYFFRVYPWKCITLFLGKLGFRFLFGFSNVNYYYLNPTMHNYWGTVNTIVSSIAVELGIFVPDIVEEVGLKQERSASGIRTMGMPVAINKDEMDELKELLPGIFSPKLNYIDVYAIATRHQMIANRRRLAVANAHQMTDKNLDKDKETEMQLAFDSLLGCISNDDEVLDPELLSKIKTYYGNMNTEELEVANIPRGIQWLGAKFQDFIDLFRTTPRSESATAALQSSDESAAGAAAKVTEPTYQGGSPFTDPKYSTYAKVNPIKPSDSTNSGSNNKDGTGTRPRSHMYSQEVKMDYSKDIERLKAQGLSDKEIQEALSKREKLDAQEAYNQILNKQAGNTVNNSMTTNVQKDAQGNVVSKTVDEVKKDQNVNTLSKDAEANLGANTKEKGAGNQWLNQITKVFGGNDSWLDHAAEVVQAAQMDGGLFLGLRVNATKGVSDSFSNSTAPIDTGEFARSVTGKVRNFNFDLSGGNILPGMSEVINATKNIALGALDGVTFGLSSVIASVLEGAYIDMPERWDESKCSLGTVSFSMRLTAPYGNPISQLQNIYIPLACLLAGTLPLGTGRSSHGSPYLCNLFSKGVLDIELGVITELSISRATSNLPYSQWMKPLAIDVDFTVTDLSNIVTVPVNRGVFQALLQDGFSGLVGQMATESKLDDYIGVLCSRDFSNARFEMPKLRRRLRKGLLRATQTFANPNSWAFALGEYTNFIAAMFGAGDGSTQLNSVRNNASGSS